MDKHKGIIGKLLSGYWERPNSRAFGKERGQALEPWCVYVMLFRIIIVLCVCNILVLNHLPEFLSINC